MESNLTNLFHGYQIAKKPPIIILENIKRETVGVLYFDKLKFDNILISETNNSEKYFLIINGIGIYFSYFQKVLDPAKFNGSQFSES